MGDRGLLPAAEAGVLLDQARAAPVHGRHDAQGQDDAPGRALGRQVRGRVRARDLGHEQHARREARDARLCRVRPARPAVDGAVAQGRRARAEREHRAVDGRRPRPARAHEDERRAEDDRRVRAPTRRRGHRARPLCQLVSGVPAACLRDDASRVGDFR